MKIEIKKTIIADWQKLLLTTIAAFALLFATQTPIAAQNDPYFEQGLKLFNEGRCKDAIVQFQKSNTLVGEGDGSYFNIGICYIRLEQYKEAIPNLRKAIALEPDHGEAYANLGLAFELTQQYEEAVVAYREAVRLLPNNQKFAKLLARAEQALAQSKGERQTNGNGNNVQNGNQAANQTDEYFAQGEKYFAAKEWKKAAKAYEKSAKLNSSNPAIFFALGASYYNSNQFTKAIAAYKRVLQLNPDFPNARQDLADAEAAKIKEKEVQDAAWASLAKSQQNTSPTQNTTTQTRRNNEKDEEEITPTNNAGNTNVNNGGGGNVQGGGRLPAGQYQCITQIYQGSGWALASRDFFDIYEDGTYRVNKDTTRSRYSYNPGTGKIQWQGEAFSTADESEFTAKTGQIYITIRGETWTCNKQ